jgi:hypothetical protein
MILGLAMETYGDKLAQEQELLMLAADMIGDTFAAESAVLRAERIGTDLAGLAAAIVAHDAGVRTEGYARTALAVMASGDNLKARLAALARDHEVAPFDTIGARRTIADDVVARKGYVFNA